VCKNASVGSETRVKRYTRNIHVDFTRQPIIETVITPREGYRLVVRSSKNASQEEHFVDALEVVSFGNALFFRCLERPKPFIVPSADYEVLEVREPRIMLKTPSQEKVSTPREQPHRQKVERVEIEKKEPPAVQAVAEREEPAEVGERPSATVVEGHSDRRRERRRPFRRRRGQNREEINNEMAQMSEPESKQEAEVSSKEEQTQEAQKILTTAPLLSSILPPPTLVRDELARLREQEQYKGAFYIRDDKEDLSDDDDTVFEVLRRDDFEEKEDRDQEVSPSEPFCDPFFEEKISETIPQDDRKNQEGIGPLEV
jgi:hypothetical protein